MSYLLGIDLGTTNSLGCVYKDGRIQLIPNRYGSYLTPSVVSVDENQEIIVGEIAKERLITAPERTASSFKRFMGEEKTFHLGGLNFTPEELSSFVVRSIVEDAQAYLGEEIEEVIISVPAYFHDKQRYATKKAGLLAGVQVHRLINEPSAAALASYMDNGEEQLFLVFDFGGGTLDVSIVDCFENVVEIEAVAGNNHLGGDDFHQIMVEAFLKEHGIPKGDVSKKDLAVLERQAEKCKRELSDAQESRMTAWIKGQEYTSVYTNRRLVEESAGIFYKIKEVLNHAVKSAQIRPEDLSDIVMAGGSSKMPVVTSYVSHLFHREPQINLNSDEMIVRGLGYLCGVKAREQSIKDYVLTDICPFSLGTATKNASDASNPYFTPIIPRSTVLPCSRVHRFYTAEDHQRQVTFPVLQGEHVYARDNRKLAEYTLTVPDGPAGQEALDVRFTYDIDGILLADIQVVSTGHTISSVVSQTVDDERLQARMKELEKLKVHPREVTENKLLLSRLTTLCEECPPSQREYFAGLIALFEKVLEEQNPRKIKKYREQIQDTIDNFSLGEAFDDFDFWGDFYQEEGEEEKEQEEKAEEDLDFMEFSKKWTN